MTAKELKEAALLAMSERIVIFQRDLFYSFCSQLCHEQREICSRQVSGWPDRIMTESEIEDEVLNAKMPEL